MYGIKKSLLTVAVLAFVTGCATPKNYSSVGGSKADGVVKLAYQVSMFEKAVVDEAAGLKKAIRRCSVWGYNSAEAYEMTEKKCIAPTMNGCNGWQVSKEYQCQNVN